METLLRAGLSNAAAATLMALVITALSRPMARRPAILHGLWVLVLIKLVTPPIYGVPISWPLASRAPSPIVLEFETVAGVAAADPDVPRPAPEIDADVGGLAARPEAGPAPSGASTFGDACRWVGLAWMAGSAIVLLLSLGRVRRFHRLLKEARGGSWSEQDWVDEWARRLGVRWAPDLRWVPGPVSPMIWFVGRRPLLILPQDLWKRLDGPQRSTLIAHELAHLRRGDHLVRLLELLVTALYWWHPLVWWMRGPLRDAEEQCCDAWVVWALPDAVRAYAETLLDTLEFLGQSGRPDPLLASGLGKVPHLRRRLTMIMAGSSRRSPGLPGKIGLLLVAASVLPVGASWAQKADEPEAVRLVVQDALQAIGRPGQVATRDLVVAADPFAERAPEDKAFIVLRLEGDDQPRTEVELSGSIADVTKKLEARIAELKAKGESSDADKDRIKALGQALEALKKAGQSTKSVAVLGDVARFRDLKEAQVRYVARLHKDGAGGDKEEVARTRKEISKLKAELKATLDRLTKAQAKLRELGEDPGDTAVVAWHRPPLGTRFETRKIVIGNDTKSVPLPNQVRVYRTVPTGKPKAAASDPQRLEQLEKRLKALQEEFDRLKKDARDHAEKK